MVAVARAAGAEVIGAPGRGYGRACAAGAAAVSDTDVMVFLDGDFSDHPDELPLLLAPIARGDADLVLGSRLRGRRERGALPPTSSWETGSPRACCGTSMGSG
jgi:glycosyltransferase involved in cell wall biosynthesis